MSAFLHSHLFIPLASAGGTPGAIAKVAEKFHVEWPMLLAQMFNFCIVAFVLHRFAFKPLLEAVAERQKKIAEGLRQAEEAGRRMARAEAQGQKMLLKASVRGQRIVERARAEAEVQAGDVHRRKAMELEKLHRRELERIELERSCAIGEARSKLKKEAVLLAKQVLGAELSAGETAERSAVAAKILMAE
ncbi:MAG: hypothetical protein LBS68_02835 [Puniceicoccales bacterium]|jgi:F-type H+-transporting ATPase subunit b|nr:hypothetical protein [Puniceicoccales bacterium]